MGTRTRWDRDPKFYGFLLRTSGIAGPTRRAVAALRLRYRVQGLGYRVQGLGFSRF